MTQLDPKKFSPPLEVVKSRREAILKAVREAQTLHEESKSKTEITPSIPASGFPITLVTTHYPAPR